MKFAISILIAVCIVDIQLANGQIGNNIETVKRNIENTVKENEKEVGKIIQQDQKNVQWKIDNAISMAKINIDSKIKVIHIYGDKKPSCIQPYKTELNGAVSKSRNDIMRCLDTTKNELNMLEREIVPINSQISSLTYELTSGHLQCVGVGSQIDYMVCVSKVMAQINLKLQALQSQAKIIIGQIKNKSQITAKNVSNCVNQANSNNEARLDSIRVEVEQCSKN